MRPRQRSVEAQRSPQQKGEPWRGITRPAASGARRRLGTPRRGQRPCPGARRCASGSAPVEAVWIEAAHPKGTLCVRGSEPRRRTTAARRSRFPFSPPRPPGRKTGQQGHFVVATRKAIGAPPPKAEQRRAAVNRRALVNPESRRDERQGPDRTADELPRLRGPGARPRRSLTPSDRTSSDADRPSAASRRSCAPRPRP